MKLDTIVELVEENDIHTFVQSLWKTDIFRNSHKEGGFVHDIVEPFSTMPCFFFRASDEYLEKAHFATWWRGIQIRDYDNPYVHDLYLLHEMYHAGDMIFSENLSPEAFARKMQDNELGASVCSEIEAYFRLPGLREKSFPFEIFADRFLKDPEIQKRWEKSPDRVVKELKMYRQNIMMSPENKHDKSEYWIKKFVTQNDIWAGMWERSYQKVEAAMIRMRNSVDNGDKAGALKNHMDWLLSEEISRGGTIPFPSEAKQFAVTYWVNKEDYDLKNGLQPQAIVLKREFDQAEPA